MAVALTLFFGGAGAARAAGAKAAPVKVKMNDISAEGVGAPVGTITLKQTKKGVELDVALSKLPPGEHGFHIHEKGMCEPGEKEGKKAAGLAAGGHWDPDATKAHKGPGGGGHKGDLPKLTVPANGKLKTKLTVEGLKLAELGQVPDDPRRRRQLQRHAQAARRRRRSHRLRRDPGRPGRARRGEEAVAGERRRGAGLVSASSQRRSVTATRGSPCRNMSGDSTSIIEVMSRCSQV